MVGEKKFPMQARYNMRAHIKTHTHTHTRRVHSSVPRGHARRRRVQRRRRGMERKKTGPDSIPRRFRPLPLARTRTVLDVVVYSPRTQYPSSRSSVHVHYSGAS